MRLTYGLYTDGKRVALLNEVYGKGQHRLCLVFRTAPFRSTIMDMSVDSFKNKYPYKVVGVQLPDTNKAKQEGKLRLGMYTDGKVVVTLHHIDGTVTAYRDLPFRNASIHCSEAEFKKRYPHRIDGVVFE